MTALAILDLGYGNTESIRLAFARLGVEAALTSDAVEAEAADRLILPGVGAAGFAMERLRATGMDGALRRRSKPLLGICLGMQLLFKRSEEGGVSCLGLLPGAVRALTAAPGFPVPHMGWTRIESASPDIGIAPGDHVYFAHGLACDDGQATAATARYGAVLIPAVVQSGHLWGAQFHPERSSTAGARFLEAFLSA